MNTPFITRFNRFFLFTFVLASISLLSACGGGGGGDSGPVAANPTGYYTGTAAVTSGSGAVDIQDLQGLVDGNRFMAMSEAQELLYDGTITSISGNSFSATVKVYKNGALVAGSPTSFTGTITQSSQIIGTFSGTGTWNGTFTLVYAQSNNVASLLTTVASAVSQGEYWGGSKYPTDSIFDPQFRLDAFGAVTSFDIEGGGGGVMEFCGFYGGSIMPVVNTRLYRLTVTVGNCGGGESSVVNGTYTGLATTKGSNNNTLVMAIALGNYANASDYIRRTVAPPP